MALCRKGTDSDLYIYKHVDDMPGAYRCEFCKLTKKRGTVYLADKTQLMDHVKKHEAKKHTMPKGIWGLLEKMPTEPKRLEINKDLPKYYEFRGYKLLINTRMEPIRWEYCAKNLYITLSCEDNDWYTAEWSYVFTDKKLDETNRTEEYVNAKTANKALKLLDKKIESNYKQYTKHFLGK